MRVWCLIQSLVYFYNVRHVDFSPIQIGQSESEIIKVLGEPTDRLNSGTGSTILSYGGYEFGLWDNELHYFQNDNLRYQYLHLIKTFQ